MPGRGLPIKFVGFRNFEWIFNDPLFWRSLQLTVIYTLGVTMLTLIGGLIIASCLSRITRHSSIFRSLAMLPWAVPLVISGFIWRWIFNPDIGIFNDILINKLYLSDNPIPVFSDPTYAMLGVIIADAWVRIPFMAIITLAGIESIPQDLYDVAKVDGADCFSTFRNITLPLAKKPMLVGLLITSMFTFRTVDVIFAMTAGGPAKATYVLGYYIIDQLWLRVDYGVGAATGVVMLLLIASFAALFVYYILKE
jgi:multiple sugar transport system permease protein